MANVSFISAITANYNTPQLILLVLCFIMILSLSYTSSNISVSETQSYAAIISVLMIVVAISLFKMTTDSNSSVFIRGSIVSIILLFMMGGIVTEFYKNYIKRSDFFDRASRDPTTRVMMNIVEISLVISIIVVGISLSQNMIGRYLNNSTDWFGFILNLIVYIPCLLEDLILYFKQQYNITPSVTFILMGIEAGLIALYVLLPKLFNSKLLDDTIQILDDPAFLDIPITKNFTVEDEGDRGYKRANYAISMWVYINQQNNIVDKANIFKYEGNLKIEYIKSENQIKDKYRITIRDPTPHDDKDDPPSYDINVPNQKWNNIVLNFNENRTVDIFVNGNLERTFAKSNRTNTKHSNTIEIGSPKGLYGAICNIKYYKKPLSSVQIAQGYNLLYNKNPPTNKIM